jgi:hypothetical protein
VLSRLFKELPNKPLQGPQPVVTVEDQIAERLFELFYVDQTGSHDVLRFGENDTVKPYSCCLIDGNFDLNEIARKLYIHILASHMPENS